MYLSKLELHGFKSFAERTKLEFDPGVTAIVGPNGCGKSNIVDAVRWVIGEQRPTALRSEKMENVIFNGTADRRRLGMSEVQLTIENNRSVLPTEYSEVTIGRRLFRDGKSEYLMNGTQCRLKDITDLFMDTGMGADAYSVIELKMIDEILSDSTEDRRRMFEEAAGITRYKMRRRQALRKLDNTQTDLDRIRDLTDEIGTQVRRLKRQAKKAAQYKEYEDRRSELERVLLQVEYDRLTERQQTLRAERAEHEAAAERLTGELAEAEGTLEALREQLDERERDLNAQREALQQHRARVSELEAEQRLQRERLDRARRDRSRLREAQEEAATQRADLVRTIQELEARIEAEAPRLQDAEQQLDEARVDRDNTKEAARALREQVRDLRRREQEAGERQADRRRELDRLANRVDLLEEEQARTREQADILHADVDTLDARVAEAEAARSDAADALDRARYELEQKQAEREEQEDVLQEALDRLRDLERQRDAVEAEVQLLESLVASYEEFSDAVQFLATTPQRVTDDLRTVADVLACDDDVRVALDTALGELASCVVVESPEEARTAISMLRGEDKGQASFIVLDRLPDPSSNGAWTNGTAPGDTMPLYKVVRTTEDQYRPLARILLHHCYLSDTLEAAEEAAEQSATPARVFARTGEWVDARGVLKGGSRKTSASPVASRLGRREQLEHTREQWTELAAAYEKQEQTVQAERAALAQLDLDPPREAVEEAEHTLSQAEQRVQRARYERETAHERRDELSERVDQLARELEERRAAIQALRGDVADAEEERDALRAQRTEAEAALEAAEAEERAAVNRYSELNVAVIEARNQLANARRDRERTAQRIEEIDRRQEARAAELAELETTIEAALDAQSDLDARIEEIRAERAARDEAVADAESRLQATKVSMADVEATLRRLREEREQAMRRENKAAVQLAEVETRTVDLLDDAQEDYEIDLTETTIDIPEDFKADPARREAKELRDKIKRLGNVNPLALEEYETEKERHDFLVQQQQDLERAEDTLLETITEINTKAAERFQTTYNAIQESFSQIFTDLFGEGASAELRLADPGDPLDTDIEIIAQPRGKRPSTLNQLSSGEKTLTATALLFAIYLVKPSPFCILDEVDAPLDDANVERFMNLIRRFESDTQFILVTHNQRTMALADRMYGVTMQEQGVSKLVGVEFDEAVELAG